MSYCAIENTATGLDQVIEMMIDAKDEQMVNLKTFVAGRSCPQEREAVHNLYDMCSQYIRLYEMMDRMDSEEEYDDEDETVE
jgi:hypothetical protein